MAARISAAGLTQEETKTVSQDGAELGRAGARTPGPSCEAAAGGPRPPRTPRPASAQDPVRPQTRQRPPR